MLRRLAPLKRILTTIRHLAKKMADGYLVLWFYASKKRHTINIQNCTKRWKLTFSHISSRSKVKIAEVRTKFVLIRQSSLDQPLAVYCTVPLVLHNTEYHVWQLWLVSINWRKGKVFNERGHSQLELAQHNLPERATKIFSIARSESSGLI